MASLKDVANLAGVSTRTVNRALKNSGYIRDDTKEVVLAAARSLGYRPNRAARSLRTGRSHEATVVIGTLDELHLRAVAGFEQTMRAAGFTVNIIFLPRSRHTDENTDAEGVCEELRERCPAAVAIFPQAARFTTPLARQLLEMNTPSVYIDGRNEGSSRDNIFIDRQQGVYDAVHYLAASGSEVIAFSGSESDRSRLDGYHRAVKELLRQAVVFVGEEDNADSQFAAGGCAAKVFAKLSPRPDAVIMHTDLKAMGFLAGLSTLGLRVPGDVRVIGFDNREAAAYANPPLTTVAQPNWEVGIAAGEILLAKISGADTPPGGWSRTLPTELVIREST